MTYYAWTNIHFADKKGEAEVLKAGEEASASGLNLTDEQFQQLIDARSVRESKYPKMPESFAGSPKDFVLAKRARELQDVEDNFGDDQFDDEPIDDEIIAELKDPIIPPEPAFTHSDETVAKNKGVVGTPANPTTPAK